MSLNEIIQVSIDRNTTTVDRTGFGIPLVAAHVPLSLMPQRVVSFSSVSGMITAGFTVNDPAYKAVAAAFAQNPSPPTVKVGRRDLPPTQIIEITPNAPVTGEVHTVTITGYADSAFASRAVVTDTHTLTITTETDEEDIVDDFITNLTETGDYLLSKNGTGAAATLRVTAQNTTMTGLLFEVVVTTDTMGVDDITASDPGIATDLAAIELYDPDWYGLAIDSNSAVEIAAASLWAQSNEKLAVFETRDIEVASTTNTADSTSIAATLEDGTRGRSFLFYHRTPGEYIGMAMLGNALPEDPGTINWAYRQLQGITAQGLNATERGNLESKNVNFFVTRAGVAVTQFGTMSQADWADELRGSDWLKARLQEDLVSLLINNDKVAYTNAGLSAIRGVVLARLQDGVARGFLSNAPEPSCEVPNANDVLASLKASRTVDPVKFRAVVASAVNKIVIEGELALS